MNQSKPGKKLSPIIAEQTAPIYARDPVRYERLCLWVWTQQKKGWPDEAIAEALKMADGTYSNLDKAENWWKYLTILLPKAKGKATDTESKNYKSEVGEIAADFLEFMKQRREVLH